MPGGYTSRGEPWQKARLLFQGPLDVGVFYDSARASDASGRCGAHGILVEEAQEAAR
jgi:hypothetical protein